MKEIPIKIHPTISPKHPVKMKEVLFLILGKSHFLRNPARTNHFELAAILQSLPATITRDEVWIRLVSPPLLSLLSPSPSPPRSPAQSQHCTVNKQTFVGISCLNIYYVIYFELLTRVKFVSINELIIGERFYDFSTACGKPQSSFVR